MSFRVEAAERQISGNSWEGGRPGRGRRRGRTVSPLNRRVAAQRHWATIPNDCEERHRDFGESRLTCYTNGNHCKLQTAKEKRQNAVSANLCPFCTLHFALFNTIATRRCGCFGCGSAALVNRNPRAKIGSESSTSHTCPPIAAPGCADSAG